MPPRKRHTCVASSHEEVYRLVRERRIHLAEELYRLSEERRSVGEGSLWLYCTGQHAGQVGMKKTLQSTIDLMWVADEVPSCPARRADGVSAAHAAPLTSSRLLELKRNARLVPRLPGSAEPIARRMSLAGVTRIRDAKVNSQGCSTASQPTSSSRTTSAQVHLFDSSGPRAEVVMTPRNRTWRLRDFYEILVACQAEGALAGTRPSAAPEGGFAIPRAEAGWHALLRAGKAKPRVQFEQLTPVEARAAAAEIRFSHFCGNLTWRPPAAASKDSTATSEEEEKKKRRQAWVDAMPNDPQFEVDTLANLPFEERVVRLWADNWVEDRQWLALLRALEACKHVVIETTGFKLARGNMQVTGRTHTAIHHRSRGAVTFGATVAQVGLAELTLDAELLAEGRRRGPWMASGSDRCSKARPEWGLGFGTEVLLALAAAAPGRGPTLMATAMGGEARGVGLTATGTVSRGGAPRKRKWAKCTSPLSSASTALPSADEADSDPNPTAATEMEG